MPSHAWLVRRTRNDILRLLLICSVLALGLLVALQVSVSVAFSLLGAGEFPGGEDLLYNLAFSMALAVPGAAGLAIFSTFRLPQSRLRTVRRALMERHSGNPVARVLASALSRLEASPSPAETHDFRRDHWALSFAVACVLLCLALSFAGLAYYHEELDWFFSASAFMLSIPIALFWISHGAGGKGMESETVLWGLAAGVLCALPAVLLEIALSSATWGISAFLGIGDGTILNLIDGAVNAPLVEEGVKFGAVVLLLLLGKVHSRRGGFVAGICVGLGFAFFENILYYSAGGSPVLLLRPINMALHMLGPALAGAAMGGYQGGTRRIRFAAAGLAFGILVHAGWNGVIGGMPYLQDAGIRLSGTDQSVLLLMVAHLFVTPLLICGALFVAGRRLAR